MSVGGFHKSVTDNNTNYPFYIRPENDPTGCKASEELIFDPLLMTLSVIYMIFGFLYTVFGYRFFKAHMFLTGFTFATIIIYAIGLQDNWLPHGVNVFTAIFGGVLFGSITMLIQYVGLFVNGLHTGFLLAMVGLAAYDHILTVYPTSYITSVATMTSVGILFASLNLYWKKGMTVFGTSFYGAGLFTVSLDYFYERAEMLKWLWERAKLQAVLPTPCNFTWIFLVMWPTITFCGCLLQVFKTGTGIRHEESISAQKRRLQNQQARPITREQRDELRQKKYRYLYQVRTAHGDVISQFYVKALQDKAQMSNGNRGGAGECNTLKSDSTHLTVLPGSDHHNESDEEMRQIHTVN